MNILYIGPWASDGALLRRKAASQAAASWARGLIQALSETGCSVRVCTHCREQIWPLGEACPGGSSDFLDSLPVRFSRYWNLPLGRNASLVSNYRTMVEAELVARRPDVVLLYNMEPCHCAAADVLTAHGVPWVPVILDDDEVGKEGWGHFSSKVRDAAGVVFVSHWGFTQCPSPAPKLHLDGGVAQNGSGAKDARDAGVRGVQAAQARTVVYSGVYDERYGGLANLFDIFAAVEDKSCRFLLTGKDPAANLKKYLRREPRAEYLGFLDPDSLRSVHEEATVFVNPRTSGARENRMTFPSKLLVYLSYAKPIVSTWTEGMSPEYRDLLLIPARDTPQAYAALIDTLLDHGPDVQGELRQRIAAWASAHTWRSQAQRLLQWIDTNDLGRTSR